MDVCYVGQSHWIGVPLVLAWLSDDARLGGIGKRFRDLHNQIHGHGEGGPTRIINLRAVASARSAAPSATPEHIPSGAAPLRGERDIVVEDLSQPVSAKLYDRAALEIGARLIGPAIIERH